MHFIPQNNDSGRSMIEILGVLAVMAVLTIGAIFFYKMAITKSKAVDVYGSVGLAASQMMIKQKPNIKPVRGISIESRGVSGVGNNVLVRVDFKEDADLCKEVKSMYENSTEYVFIGNCE